MQKCCLPKFVPNLKFYVNLGGSRFWIFMYMMKLFLVFCYFFKCSVFVLYRHFDLVLRISSIFQLFICSLVDIGFDNFAILLLQTAWKFVRKLKVKKSFKKVIPSMRNTLDAKQHAAMKQHQVLSLLLYCAHSTGFKELSRRLSKICESSRSCSWLFHNTSSS